MKNDYFSHLKLLISKLEPREVKVAQKFIVAFYSSRSRGGNKSLKLFRLLVQRPDIARNDAKRLVSKEADNASFRRLVVRLTDKICDAVLLDHSIQRNDSHSKINKIRFELRKKLMQSQIFRTRGLTSVTISIYDQIIEKARQYELYNEMVEALSLKQQLLGLTVGAKEFYQISHELNHFERCRMAVLRAKDWYYRHYLEVDSTGLNNDRVGLLTEAIADLQEEFRATQSQNVGYILYALKMEYYLAVEEYKTSCETGISLVRLIENNRLLFNDRMLANAYYSLSDSKLYVQNFEEAIYHAKKAQSILIPGSFNFQKSLEMELLAFYYKGHELDRVTELTEELLSITDRKKTPFLFSQRSYYKACILFLKGEYRKSFFLLNDTREIEKDREGWNIGIRTLSIMNQIEMMFLDFADAQIESMRKHVQRVKAQSSIRKRDEIILQLLLKLEKHSFDFQKVFDTNQDLFALLDSEQKAYRWEVRTPEMIVFQDWFKAKIAGKPYHFLLPGEEQVVEETVLKSRAVVRQKSGS